VTCLFELTTSAPDWSVTFVTAAHTVESFLGTKLSAFRDTIAAITAVINFVSFQLKCRIFPGFTAYSVSFGNSGAADLVGPGLCC